MTKVYMASKLRHSAMLRELVLSRTDICFTARWPYFEHQVPDTKEHASHFWSHDFNDVTYAEVVVVYAEQDDKLRGALVEVGYALALGKPVIVIGDHADYGTWRHANNVRRALDIKEALMMAHRITA